MVRPLDHVTVIQQINFAEREQQNLHNHPQLSQLAAEEVELRRAAEQRRRTTGTEKSERAAVRPSERRGERESGKKKRRGEDGKGRNLDLKA